MSVIIIDYGMGNLGSVKRAFEECGAEVQLASDPKSIEDASHIVLPGVGAYFQGMAELKKRGWVEPLQNLIQEPKPLLGICLGMQLLSEFGEEGGGVSGLGLIPGKVTKIPPCENLRLPHVGWNEVSVKNPHALLEKIPNRTDFYFVHSYIFEPTNKEHVLGETEYGNRFASVVGFDHIVGVQFHPEKSQQPGFRLIKNFLEITC